MSIRNDVIGFGINGATFAGDNGNRKFRYALWRIWDKSLGALLFIGLNPSTAGAFRDDPTVVRMVNFAKSWGFGGLYVANLFSIVSSDPAVLLTDTAKELYDGQNDVAIEQMRGLSTRVMVGWGEFGKRVGYRSAEVLDLVGEPVYCIKMNKSGEPSHPLYLPGNSKLILYYRKGAK